MTAVAPGATATTDVPRDALRRRRRLPAHAGAGIDATTLTTTTVKLYRTSDRAPVTAVLNTSGGGDAIVLTPTALLDAEHELHVRGHRRREGHQRRRVRAVHR